MSLFYSLALFLFLFLSLSLVFANNSDDSDEDEYKINRRTTSRPKKSSSNRFKSNGPEKFGNRDLNRKSDESLELRSADEYREIISSELYSTAQAENIDTGSRETSRPQKQQRRTSSISNTRKIPEPYRRSNRKSQWSYGTRRELIEETESGETEIPVGKKNRPNSARGRESDSDEVAAKGKKSSKKKTLRDRRLKSTTTTTPTPSRRNKNIKRKVIEDEHSGEEISGNQSDGTKYKSSGSRDHHSVSSKKFKLVVSKRKGGKQGLGRKPVHFNRKRIVYKKTGKKGRKKEDSDEVEEEQQSGEQ